MIDVSLLEPLRDGKLESIWDKVAFLDARKRGLEHRTMFPWRCTACDYKLGLLGAETPISRGYNYCNHCGTDMREV